MTEHLMEHIEQALDTVAREHENRQAPNVNDGYTNEMEWAFNTLIDARDEIKRLRQMVRQLFDKVDESFAFGWAVKNIGEQDMPWFRSEDE